MLTFRQFFFILGTLISLSPHSIAQNSQIVGSCQSAGYACYNVNQLELLPLEVMGGGNSNHLRDLWGWKDPGTNKEYAIVGLQDRTAFVDVTDGDSPKYIGYLKSHNDLVTTGQRDIKVHNNYAYIVAQRGDHGMQIFDLIQLRNIESGPQYNETAHFDFAHAGAAASLSSVPLGSSYNLFISSDSNSLYVVGSKYCGGGLFMFDISDPLSPMFQGCFSQSGFIFDVQCVTYQGPDTYYNGHEICFTSDRDGITIVDATYKESVQLISVLRQNHFDNILQGWLTEDHRYFLMNDDRDNGKTLMRIVDVRDLDFPKEDNQYTGLGNAKPGNLYIKGKYGYLSNHKMGLRILDVSMAGLGNIEEYGYFDTFKQNDGYGYDGAIGVYPFFNTKIIVSSKAEGLFILQRMERVVPVTVPFEWVVFLQSLIEPTRSFFQYLLLLPTSLEFLN